MSPTRKSLLSIIVIASSVFATAIPVNATIAPSPDIITHITICTGINLGGDCEQFTIPTQTTCIGTHGTEYDNNIRSIVVQSGFRCRLWDSNVCNGDSTPDIYAPGSFELPSNMINKATSFKCYQN